MSVLDELLQAQNSTYLPLEPPPSLIDMKIDRVGSRLQNKVDKIQNTDALDDYRAAREARGSGNGSLGALLGSSLTQEGANLDSLAVGLQNYATGGNEQVSEESKLRGTSAYADQLSGYSPEARAEFEAAKGSAMGSFKDAYGNFGEGDIGKGLANSAIGLYKGAKISPEIVMESLPMMLEMGAGAAIAPVAGAVGSFVGLAALGSKAYKLAGFAEKVGKSFEEVKDLSKLQKAGMVLKKSPKDLLKALASTSLVTSAALNRAADESAANGDVWDEKRYLFNYVPYAISYTVQGKVVKDFGKSFIDDTADVVKSVINLKPKSGRVEILKRIGAGLASMAKVGGGEGVQEYMQTWSEIVAKSMPNGSWEEMLASVGESLQDSDKQAEAFAGAGLGMSTGMSIKGVTAIPATVAGSTVDVAKSTAKYGGRFLKDRANKASYKVLPQSSRDALKVKAEEERAAYKETEKDLNARYENVNSANSIDEVTNEGAKEDIAVLKEKHNILDSEINDPKYFNKNIKKRLKEEYVGRKAIEKEALKGNSAVRLVATVGKNAAKITTEAADKVLKAVGTDVEAIKKTSKTIYNAVKNVDTELLKGVAVVSSDIVADTAKESYTSNISKLTELIKAADADNGTIKNLRKIIKGLKDKNPSAYEKVSSIINSKEKAGLDLKLINKKITTGAKLPTSIQEVDVIGVNESNAKQVKKDIAKVLRGKPAKSSKPKLLKAIEAYAKTDIGKADTELRALQNRIKGIRDPVIANLRKKASTKIAETVVEVAAKLREVADNYKAKTFNSKSILDKSTKDIQASEAALDALQEDFNSDTGTRSKDELQPLLDADEKLTQSVELYAALIDSGIDTVEGVKAHLESVIEGLSQSFTDNFIKDKLEQGRALLKDIEATKQSNKYDVGGTLASTLIAALNKISPLGENKTKLNSIGEYLKYIKDGGKDSAKLLNKLINSNEVFETLLLNNSDVLKTAKDFIDLFEVEGDKKLVTDSVKATIEKTFNKLDLKEDVKPKKEAKVDSTNETKVDTDKDTATDNTVIDEELVASADVEFDNAVKINGEAAINKMKEILNKLC